MHCEIIINSVSVNVRDLLSWIRFINLTLSELGPVCSCYHGACLVFIDGIGCGSGPSILSSFDTEQMVKGLLKKYGLVMDETTLAVEKGDEFYGISPFYIEKGMLMHNSQIVKIVLFNP